MRRWCRTVGNQPSQAQLTLHPWTAKPGTKGAAFSPAEFNVMHMLKRHAQPLLDDWSARHVCYAAFHTYPAAMGYTHVYVGIAQGGLNSRVPQHVASAVLMRNGYNSQQEGSLLQQHIAQHGLFHTVFVPLQVVPGITGDTTAMQWRAAARRVEADWISIFQCITPGGYNKQRPGGRDVPYSQIVGNNLDLWSPLGVMAQWDDPWPDVLFQALCQHYTILYHSRQYDDCVPFWQDACGWQ